MERSAPHNTCGGSSFRSQLLEGLFTFAEELRRWPATSLASAWRKSPAFWRMVLRMVWRTASMCENGTKRNRLLPRCYVDTIFLCVRVRVRVRVWSTPILGETGNTQTKPIHRLHRCLCMYLSMTASTSTIRNDQQKTKYQVTYENQFNRTLRGCLLQHILLRYNSGSGIGTSEKHSLAVAN